MWYLAINPMVVEIKFLFQNLNNRIETNNNGIGIR